MPSMALSTAVVAENVDGPVPGSGERIVWSDAASVPEYTVVFARSGETCLIGFCKGCTVHRASDEADARDGDGEPRAMGARPGQPVADAPWAIRDSSGFCASGRATQKHIRNPHRRAHAQVGGSGGTPPGRTRGTDLPWSHACNTTAIQSYRPYLAVRACRPSRAWLQHKPIKAELATPLMRSVACHPRDRAVRALHAGRAELAMHRPACLHACHACRAEPIRAMHLHAACITARLCTPPRGLYTRSLSYLLRPSYGMVKNSEAR